jgi:glycosyltransferase involved in cell wall biosynthesis
MSIQIYESGMFDINISVVIPTYNRAVLLERALKSVIAQSYAANEIIVVDDGSTDKTKQLIENNYPQIRYIVQINKGVSAARNTGIEAATNNWICLLDSDDSWQPDKLEKQSKALAEKPEYLLCHTNEIWYRNGKVLNQGKKHEKRGGYIFQHCLPLCAISPSSVMLNKQIFDQVGLFDENLPACEDYDMWLRICCKHPILFLDEALTNKYGGHDDQLSRKHWGMDRFRIIALQKSIESNNLHKTDRQAAINMLLTKISIFLKGAEKHGKNELCDKFEALAKQYA